MISTKLPIIPPLMVLLVLGLAGCQNNSSMTASTLNLTGHPVAPALADGDLSVGHGHFKLENLGNQAITVQLSSLTLLIGDELRDLTVTTVYDQAKERELNAAGIPLGPDEKLDLLLGFPEVSYRDTAGLRVEVVATFSAGEATYSATSPVIYTRRIPR